MKAYKPLIVRTYVAPKLYPSGYIILALVITQLYLEFSTQPLALSLKSTIERFAGQGFVNAAFKFLVGAVSLKTSPFVWVCLGRVSVDVGWPFFVRNRQHGAEAFWTLSQCIRYHCDFVTGVSA